MTKIQCPYCSNPFEINATYNNAVPEEIEALPYARDINLFDPGPKEQSEMSRIGKDFFLPLHYERIGILHMEPKWHVRYCVARCPRCKRLIDVFGNFTKGMRLAEMWPHLLARDHDGDIIPDAD